MQNRSYRNSDKQLLSDYCMHLVLCSASGIFVNTHSKFMYQVQPSLPQPEFWFERLLTWLGHAMDLTLACEHGAPMVKNHCI